MLWSLARTQNAETFSPFASKLARDLIKLALFDREVHIRRAASAAFQEHVGRMVRYGYIPFRHQPSFMRYLNCREYSHME